MSGSLHELPPPPVQDFTPFVGGPMCGAPAHPGRAMAGDIKVCYFDSPNGDKLAPTKCFGFYRAHTSHRVDGGHEGEERVIFLWDESTVRER